MKKKSEHISVDAEKKLNEIDMFLLNDREVVDRSMELFDNESNVGLETIEFAKGKSDVCEWIERNRRIKGSQFSFDYAGTSMMLGKRDRKLEKAPRPYLMQYLNDRTKDKTVIKCRQCLTEETSITIEDEKGNLDFETVENLFRQDYRGSIIYKKEGKKSRCNVKRIWESGLKDILEITTGGGKKLRCSFREKIWNVDKGHFVLAKNLKRGDHVELYSDSFGGAVLDFGIPQLIGYMCSDGSFFRTEETGRYSILGTTINCIPMNFLDW